MSSQAANHDTRLTPGLKVPNQKVSHLDMLRTKLQQCSEHLLLHTKAANYYILQLLTCIELSEQTTTYKPEAIMMKVTMTVAHSTTVIRYGETLMVRNSSHRNNKADVNVRDLTWDSQSSSC